MLQEKSCKTAPIKPRVTFMDNSPTNTTPGTNSSSTTETTPSTTSCTRHSRRFQSIRDNQKKFQQKIISHFNGQERYPKGSTSLCPKKRRAKIKRHHSLHTLIMARHECQAWLPASR